MLDQRSKKKIDARLRRVEGQVAGIQRMIEDDRYCVDVMLQIAAVRSALGRVGQLVLAQHVDTCFSKAMAGDDLVERQPQPDALTDIIAYAGLR